MDSVKLDSPLTVRVDRKHFYQESHAEKRITDRRGLDRRNRSKKIKSYLLAAIISAVVLLAAAIISINTLTSGNKTGGTQWIYPDQVKLLTTGKNSASFGQVGAAFDDKLTTGWTLPLAKQSDFKLQALFKNSRLIQGISIHATPAGIKSSAFPEGVKIGKLALYQAGKKIKVFSLVLSDSPQFLEIKPFTADNLTLFFTRSGASYTPVDIFISDIRFLGMAYE